MNSLQLVGRSTQDVTIVETKGAKLARVTVAVNRDYKDKDGNRPVDFLEVTVFGKLAEIAANYVKKGSLIALEGSIRQNNYEKDGQMVYGLQIVGDKLTLLESKAVTDARAAKAVEADTPVVTDEQLPF